MGHGNLFAHMHIVSTGTHVQDQKYPQSHLQNWINTGTRERKVTVAKLGSAIKKLSEPPESRVVFLKLFAQNQMLTVLE